MADVGDIYQLKMQVTHPADRECLSVFYYEVVDGGSGTDAEEVADEFVTEVVGAWADIATDQTVCNQLETTNGMNNSDWNVTNPSVSGTVTAQSALPPFICVSYLAPRFAPGQRNSYKRMVGGWSALLNTTDGSWGTTPMAGVFSVLGIAMSAPLTTSNSILIPVQVTGGFRLGVTPVAQFSWGQNLQINQFPGHQVSRTRRVYQAVNY